MTRLAVLATACLALPAVRAQPQAPKAAPIDRRPYEIRVLIDFDPGTRIDAAGRSAVLEEWRELTGRFVGEPWAVEIVADLGPLPAIPIAELKANDLRPSAGKADKVWAIRVRPLKSGYALEGREMDVATGWLGVSQTRNVANPPDLPRGLLRLTLAMFAPSAEVGESKAGGVSFLVQGGALPVASPLGEVAPVGSIFRALRVFPKDDGSAPEIVEVRYSYFRVEKREGAVARCEIIRGLGDPLTNRYARKNKLVALGIRPASTPTRLRFLLKGDRLPAAGYKLIGRSIPPGPKPEELGMTDREGRIVLAPGFAEGLVSLRLLAGNEEPIVDLPVMPGETPDERTIIIEPRLLTLALEARLDALRDGIVDVIASRSRFEARMKARLDGEDWAGLDEAIREFRKLTPREHFEKRLDQIRADGERQELESKTLVLTRNARAQLDETKGLIDRYLDDDAIRSYEDAAQRAKAERARPKVPEKAAKKPAR